MVIALRISEARLSDFAITFDIWDPAEFASPQAAAQVERTVEAPYPARMPPIVPNKTRRTGKPAFRWDTQILPSRNGFNVPKAA
jgi:hypothetical protein